MVRIALLLSLLLSLPLQASVYRWVDDDGKVHYGDRPPQAAERLQVDVPKGKPAPENAGRPGPSPTPEGAQNTPLADGKADASYAEKCEEMRRRVKMYQARGRLVADTPDGERRELDEAEREELISNARQQAEQACNRAKELGEPGAEQ